MKTLDIVWTSQFKKDYKLAMKRHFDIGLLDDIIRQLASRETLPEKNRDHFLTGEWKGYRAVSYTHLDVYKRQVLESKENFVVVPSPSPALNI